MIKEHKPERRQANFTLPVANYAALQREARERGVAMNALAVLWTEEIIQRQEIADEAATRDC